MFDDDNYSDPGYDGGSYGPTESYDQNYSNGPDKKKLITYGIIGIVILAIVFFAFSYINSQETVTFNINEKDGLTVSTEKLVIYDASKNPIYSERGSTHTITLAPGTYTYKISSLEYKPLEKTLEIGKGGTRNEPIYLYKDIDAELSITNLSTTTIYAGQTISGTLTISNEGSSPINNQRLISDNDFFEVEFTPEKISVSSGGTTGADFTIKIADDISEEENEKLELRLAGTNDDVSQDLIALPTVAKKDIKIGGDIKNNAINNEKLEAGKVEIIDKIEIENDDDDIDLSNVELEILPAAGFESKLNWFEFANYTGEKYKLLIDKLESGEEIITILNVKPPFSQEIDDEFRGVLKISSLSMEEDIEINLYFAISKKNEAKLEFNIKNYETDCILGGECDEIVTINTGASKIENKGDVPIENIYIDTLKGGKANDYCELWITLNEKTVGKLEKDETYVIAWDINPDTSSEDTTHICYLTWSYKDPFNPTETIYGETDPFSITVNKEEPKP